jgi:putative membrane protein
LTINILLQKNSISQNNHATFTIAKIILWLKFQSTRVRALELEGKAQREYPSSNQGWFVTVFMLRGRALHRIAYPWSIVTLHAILYTVIQEVVYKGSLERGQTTVLTSWEVVFSFVLNSTLSFLLVFRLQRASERYWIARFYWGDVIAKARTLVSGLVVHATPARAGTQGGYDEKLQVQHRDHAIRWLNAYAVAIMQLLRGLRKYDGNSLAGILVGSEMQKLEQSPHPPLYAMTKLRSHLREALRITADTPVPIAVERAQTLHRLELHLDTIQDCCGGMERIKATPLPIVYVSHLRTFLIVALM